MKIPNERHNAQPWLVHELAQDFKLEDVWQLPVHGDGEPGSDLEALGAIIGLGVAPSSGATGMLFRLRLWLGEVFGWDKAERLPIPGKDEQSVAERLPAELRGQAPAFDPNQEFQLVYSLAHERLLEISNSTVHALMHLGWVAEDDGQYSARMAVYSKPRGLFGRLYMGLITPFRLWIVYPALLRHIGQRWRKRPNSAGIGGVAQAH